MQFAIPMRQLARIYVDAQSLTITAEQLAELTKSADLLKRMGTSAILPLSVVDPTLSPLSPRRSVLTSATAEWQLALLGSNFDVTRLPMDVTGSNVGGFGEFATTSAEILWECSRIFGRPAHRLALSQTGMLGEMSSNRMDEIARVLLRLPASFDNQSPFEWDWRAVRHGTMVIGGRNDKLNVLATVKRTSGTFQSPTEHLVFDRIVVELDVNTSSGDTRGRFDKKEDLQEFFSAAINEHGRLSAELTAFAFGGPS